LAARATYSAAMLEPAPGLSSTTILLAKEVGGAIAKSPCCYVGSRSWREAHNETDWTRRIGFLGFGRAAQKWQRDSTDCQMKNVVSPVNHNRSANRLPS